MIGMPAEVTVFEKAGGALTKRIALRDGRIVNDSSACFMTRGTARRVKIENVQELADLINNFKPSEAYALGRLKDGLPDRVRVVRKEDLNGVGDPHVIARTKNYIAFNEGEPGLALLDFDRKGMSETAERRMEECGGDFWGALIEILPASETVACVERASTSSGLRDINTAKTFPDSGGRHIVVPVVDAADIPRFLSDLFDRCWLAGFGWGMVSAAGSFLERAIIDKAVGSPERLIFEGAPIIELPLRQEGRDAKAHDGFVLDTQLCLPLSDEEKARVRELKAAENRRLLPERQSARARWSTAHIERLTAAGMSEPEARATVDRWIDRKELNGAFQLPFDEADIAGATVADVLAAPDRYIGKTLSDPFEGPDYGRGKAIVYRRDDGSLFVNSFAHGGITYELKGNKAAALELRYGHVAALPQPIGTIVKGILHAGSLTLFYGPPKSGKSFLVTDLFLDIATTGRDDWMGHAIVRHGPVLYVACEGHAGFWKRLRAAEIDRNVDLPDDFVLAIGRPHLIQIHPKSHVAVPHPDDVADAVKRATRYGHTPIAVAIDTVFRSIGGGNVSASDHMNAYLAALAAITDAGVALAAVHHETKAGGTPAGSVTMIGGADTVINTQKLEGGHCWNVEMAKDDCETEARAFTLEIVDVGADSDGQAQTSCVVRGGDGIVKATKKPKSPPTPAQARFRDIVTDAIAERGNLVVPKSGMPTARGITRRAARECLIKAGFFHEGDIKPDGKLQRAACTKEWNALNALQYRGIFGFSDEFVWLL